MCIPPRAASSTTEDNFPQQRRACFSLVKGIQELHLNFLAKTSNKLSKVSTCNEKKQTIFPTVYVLELTLRNSPKVKTTIPLMHELITCVCQISQQSVTPALWAFVHMPSSLPFGFLLLTHLLACSFQRDRDYNVYHPHGGPLEHEPARPRTLRSETASLLPRKKKKRPKLLKQKTLVAINHVSVRTKNLVQKHCLGSLRGSP